MYYIFENCLKPRWASTIVRLFMYVECESTGHDQHLYRGFENSNPTILIPYSRELKGLIKIKTLGDIQYLYSRGVIFGKGKMMMEKLSKLLLLWMNSVLHCYCFSR